MKKIKIKIPTRISSDIEGYSRLLELYQQVKNLEVREIIFDFSSTIWFEANLAAVFGVIADYANENENSISLQGMSYRIENILKRNGFLLEYGIGKEDDIHGTTISYKKFNPQQGLNFSKYIKQELLSKPDFPSLSKLLAKKISESIYELFENARTHGKCNHIYTCGQYYPNKRPARINITIVDLGVSIKKNVNSYLRKNDKSLKTGPDAINWAIQKGNTTKTGNISGGLGLDLVMEFLKLNKGKIQIVSSDGFWEYRNGKIDMKILDDIFKGTIVNIEFNLSIRVIIN
jgi:hypothetical protein